MLAGEIPKQVGRTEHAHVRVQYVQARILIMAMNTVFYTQCFCVYEVSSTNMRRKLGQCSGFL
jgi:hypothetical protein